MFSMPFFPSDLAALAKICTFGTMVQGPHNPESCGSGCTYCATLSASHRRHGHSKVGLVLLAERNVCQLGTLALSTTHLPEDVVSKIAN